MEDYDEVYSFWQSVEGMGLSSADSREGMQTYLERNPGMSLLARDGGKIAGTVLCGHDGRRGYIHHLAVGEAYRGIKLGKTLVDSCIETFRKAGIHKCHIFIFIDNESGKEFWRSVDWEERNDVCLFSHDIDYPNY